MPLRFSSVPMAKMGARLRPTKSLARKKVHMLGNQSTRFDDGIKYTNEICQTGIRNACKYEVKDFLRVHGARAFILSLARWRIVTVSGLRLAASRFLCETVFLVARQRFPYRSRFNFSAKNMEICYCAMQSET